MNLGYNKIRIKELLKMKIKPLEISYKLDAWEEIRTRLWKLESQEQGLNKAIFMLLLEVSSML